MEQTDIIPLNPDQLRHYVEAHADREYLLVDVRQPVEYREGHIPGAMLLPLMELESKLFDLPADRDLVFYCHIGGRSMAAADLASEAEVTEKRIYHLHGGIMAWHGKILPDFPRVQVFDDSGEYSDLLMSAMDLEKGAFRFYRYLLDEFGEEPFSDTLEILSKAETAHARSIYRFWKGSQTDPPAFDELFDGLEGSILEGGETLADALDRVRNVGEKPCVSLLEMALHIEYSAYDLYRNMAEKTDRAEAKEAFLTISQAEKSHMRKLAGAIPRCTGP
jgi:sulfur-carrier protein adenylyltransferase/sulfurtransferase